ncbi:UNVERIFIED_CONTAM: hypothetical protein FKN15_041533 [Acipenser sinensis]
MWDGTGSAGLSCVFVRLASSYRVHSVVSLPIESITGAEALVENCGDGEPQKKKRATEQSISSSRGETLGSPVRLFPEDERIDKILVNAKDLKEKKELVEDKENGKDKPANGKAENEENGEQEAENEVDEEDEDEAQEEDEEEDDGAGDDDEDDDDEVEGATGKRAAEEDDEDDDVETKKQKTDDDD